MAGSGLLCCSSLPSDIFISNWRGCNYTPLHLRRAWKKAPERGRMRFPEPPPLLRLSSGVAGPHGACWPWWLQHPSHPLFCLLGNKNGVFFPSSCKNSPQDPPRGIVASPCIDVWLLVRIHLLFCALDFKENQRGPIMLMASCSVKRSQGLLH